MEKKEEEKKSKVTSYTEQDAKDKPGFVVYHSYEQDELSTFISFVNDILVSDTDIKDSLPVKNEDDLVNISKDGIALCKLINQAIPGTVDERAINKRKPLSVFHKTENLQLAIKSALGIGCHIVNIAPQVFLEGKLHLILGMLWQVMRIYLLKEINLKAVAEIIVLAEESETLEDLLKLNAEKILTRWINYHMKKSGQTIKIKEVGAELKDGTAYIYLLNQLDSAQFTLEALAMGDAAMKAEYIVSSAQKLGVKPFIRASALASGNPKLHLVFCSLLFNAKHGLQISQEKKKEVEKAALIDDAKEGTKEERTYQLWINSLGLEGVYINNLYTDTKDGIILLKVLDKVWPGSVDFKRSEKFPNGNRFKMIANGGLIVDICKKQKLVLAGIGGTDIVDSKQVQMLGLIWQIMRANYLQIIGGKSEEELVKWSNGAIKKVAPIKNLKDSSLKTGRYLIELLASIEPEVIDWSLVKEGSTEEEIELNAKYCISIARKLGATIFLTWEDIKLVNTKMLTIFVAAIMNIQKLKSAPPPAAAPPAKSG